MRQLEEVLAGMADDFASIFNLGTIYGSGGAQAGSDSMRSPNYRQKGGDVPMRANKGFSMIGISDKFSSKAPA